MNKQIRTQPHSMPILIRLAIVVMGVMSGCFL